MSKQGAIEKTIDNVIEELEDYKDFELNETDFQLFNEILKNKITKLINTKKVKKTKLGGNIYGIFDRYAKTDDNILNIFNYIINNYEYEVYKDLNFVISFRTEYGRQVESFKINKNNYVKYGVSVFINDNNLPYIITAYEFYKNDKAIKNNISENIYHNQREYVINDKPLNYYAKNKDHFLAIDNILSSILKQINDKILKDNVYSWLNEIIEDHDNEKLNLTITDLEIEDKVNFEIFLI